MAGAIILFVPPNENRLGTQAIYWSLALALKSIGRKLLCVVSDETPFPKMCPDCWEWTSGERGSQTGVPYVWRKSAPVEICEEWRDFESIFILLEGEGRNFEQFVNQYHNQIGVILMGMSPLLEDILAAKRRVARMVVSGISLNEMKGLVFNTTIPGGEALKTLSAYIDISHVAFPFKPRLIHRSENEHLSLQALRGGEPILKIIHEVASWINRVQKKGDSLSPVTEPFNSQEVELMVIDRIWAEKNQNNVLVNDDLETMSRVVDGELENLMVSTNQSSLGSRWFSEVRQNILDALLGLGPLEKWMRDPSINEIMVNGFEDIFIEKDGTIQKTDDRFSSESHLRVVVDRIVSAMGRRVDTSAPYCDVRLKDGSRVNVVLPPLSLKGPLLTIRRFRPTIVSFGELIRLNFLNSAERDFLIDQVRRKKNIVIAGNAGSGKTTLLNILSGFIPSQERIITLEDAAELKLQNEHVVSLETRPNNVEGIGEVTMHDLLINALRMRPDRLIIGECRGREVIPLLQAMNTGHNGCLTTLHANSALEALRRLESMVLLGAPRWPIEVVRKQIDAAIALVIYLERDLGRRRLKEILEISLLQGEWEGKQVP